MTRRTAPLHAVGSDERPRKRPATRTPEPQSVAQAAKSGTHRELMVAMRDRIAETVSRADCPPRELGVLTKRLQDIVKDIATLDAAADDGSAASNNDNSDDKFDTSVI